MYFLKKIKQKGAYGTPVRRHETRYPCPKPPTRRAYTLPWNQWIRMGRYDMVLCIHRHLVKKQGPGEAYNSIKTRRARV